MKVTDALWRNLLDLRQKLRDAHLSEIHSPEVVAMNETSFVMADHVDEVNNDLEKWSLLVTKTPQASIASDYKAPLAIFEGRAYLHFHQNINEQAEQIFKHYFPLAASRFVFKDQSFLITHVAQSLDGKVCTLNGASQWIGNDANLVHAHRIRAMVDGIIVGANTMRNEHPKLSVRHVSGDSPKRIVLCNSLDGFNDNDLNNTIVICREGSRACELACAARGDCELIQLASDAHGKVDVMSLRQRLYEHGIQSVMLEGGPSTVNQFIQQEAVDWLQIHIAPLLFGSGKSIYECDTIECVADALTLNNAFFVQMDDAVMLSGELSGKDKAKRETARG